MKGTMILLAGIIAIPLFVAAGIGLSFWFWRAEHPASPAWTFIFSK